jgi:hypothetical protein
MVSPFEEAAEALVVEFAKATSAWLTEHARFSERAVCARVTEAMQRRSPRFVAVNEPPYPGDALANDPRADLLLWFGTALDTPLWVEVKPMLLGSNYLNPSKFFEAIDLEACASDSIVLNDIDKLTHVQSSGGVAAFFAFVLILAGEGAPVVRDPAVPARRCRLTAGQVLDLSVRRFDRSSGKKPYMVDRCGVFVWDSAQYPFNVVLLGAELESVAR